MLKTLIKSGTSLSSGVTFTTSSQRIASAFAAVGARYKAEGRNKYAVAAALIAAGIANPALAVDPTYTSQIGDALGVINMTNIIADVAAFGGMGFTLLLATLGIFFAYKLLRRFLQ